MVVIERGEGPNFVARERLRSYGGRQAFLLNYDDGNLGFHHEYRLL